MSTRMPENRTSWPGRIVARRAAIAWSAAIVCTCVRVREQIRPNVGERTLRELGARPNLRKHEAASKGGSALIELGAANRRAPSESGSPHDRKIGRCKTGEFAD